MLEEYKKKRDFKKTREPKPSAKRNSSDSHPIFVIQKHNARRLHYDIRLEHNGVLKSWAVPKGLSDDPNEKRLAIMTEDHPMEYAEFSGTIPKGEYGAGTVEIWDRGRYANITIKGDEVQDLDDAISEGHFKIYIKGEKTEGRYAFTRTKQGWIIVKKKEEKKRLHSIESYGRTIRITNPDKEIDNGITKSELVSYYHDISNMMLPHIRGRPLSMYRFPDGVEGKKFYQKNAPEYFPEWMEIVDVAHGKKKIKYAIINDTAGIIYMANHVAEPHVTISKQGKNPDRMIFDLDPSVSDISELRKVAVSLRNFMETIGLNPYIMTSGGKGYHIVSPIKEELGHSEVRKFAFSIAEAMEKNNKSVTTSLIKEKRGNRIFIDVNRNSKSQTSIAPYGARARKGLPIACPFEWDELPNVHPQFYTIMNYPKDDAWKGIERGAVSLQDIVRKLRG
jgi:DNA ligase D-like protein (predicted polymerase)/DNA ligase D-like protein (predicted 3'-phosphoesterase)